MKRHVYRFDTVLHLKSQIEGQIKKECAALREKLVAEERRLGELDVEYAGVAETFAARPEFTAAELETHSGYLRSLRRRIDDNLKTVEVSRRAEEEKRSELVATLREKRTFEILKENDMKRHYRELERVEQRLLDEHSSAKLFGGRGRGGL